MFCIVLHFTCDYAKLKTPLAYYSPDWWVIGQRDHLEVLDAVNACQETGCALGKNLIVERLHLALCFS